LVIHEADGRIVSLTVSPPDAPLAMSAARGGQMLTEVDPSGLNLQLRDAAMAERLLEIVQHYYVERDVRPGAGARLIRR
jgi:hypothetical protein